MIDDKSELSESQATKQAPEEAEAQQQAPGDPPTEPTEPASGADAQETDAQETDAQGETVEQEPVAEEDEQQGQDDAPAAKPLELIEEPEDEGEDEQRQWYILKVQVNREKSICDALTRRVKVAGLESYFGEILIPTEDVREFTKSGKQRIVKRKLYPGYILVNMAINDDTWFLVRETPGIGDFTGAAGKPTPMETHEVDRILKTMRPPDEEGTAPEKTNIRFKQGDRVRVKEGYFQNFEGEVESIDEANGRITVMINIFGRPTPVELDHWQFEDV